MYILKFTPQSLLLIALPSSSTIVTVASSGLPAVMILGREVIVTVKVSLSSNVLSSFIVIVNEVLVVPAVKVMSYGPEE